MLPTDLPTARAWLLPLLAATACSTLPEARFPAFREHVVAAEFVVPGDGRLPLPATTAALIVHDLGAVPPPTAERFGPAGERWLLYEPGTRVRVHCHYRSYAPPGGRPLRPDEVLPGADLVEVLGPP
ncbi:MAG: hypothetical protein JNL08_21070 [Planctomycetes bacterium]|nr:hypothetical protein [Planctomycetota bacterium]